MYICLCDRVLSISGRRASKCGIVHACLSRMKSDCLGAGVRERDRAAALVENKPRFRRWLWRTNANNGVSLSGVAGFPIDILTYLSPAMMCCMYYSCVSVLNVAEMDKACWRANVLNADPFIEQLGFYLSNQLVNLLVNKYLCIIASNVKWLRKKAFKIYVSKLIFLIKLLYLYLLTDLLR